MSKMIYANKDYLTASVMVAGFDETGPHIYAIEIDGCISEEPWMLSGSGTTFVFGMMDECYKPDMSKDEIRHLMGTLIKRSIGRDSKSGGFVRIVTIDKNGVEKKYLPYDTVPV